MTTPKMLLVGEGKVELTMNKQQFVMRKNKFKFMIFQAIVKVHLDMQLPLQALF